MIYRIHKTAKLNFVSGGHAVKRLPVNAQNLGGAFAIVAGGVEHVEDVASLNLVKIR